MANEKVQPDQTVVLQLKFGGEIESFILCIKFGVIGLAG